MFILTIYFIALNVSVEFVLIYRPHPVQNVLNACISLTWGSGMGLGTRILKFFGPQMALAYWLDAISQGTKNSRIPGPNPLPLPLVMDMHGARIQNIMHGAV